MPSSHKTFFFGGGEGGEIYVSKYFVFKLNFLLIYIIQKHIKI